MKLGGLVSNVRRKLEAAGVPEPGIEARLLVQHALGMTAAALLSSLRDPAPEDALGRLAGPLTRRLKREPLSYITGAREFYGRTFSVDRRVLVPRPETELLVERATEFVAQLEGRDRPSGEGLKIADVCTGSGTLAVTLALELPGARVFGTDISADALVVARRNAEALGVTGRVAWFAGDLASPLTGQFDIVVSNPPYVPSADIDSGEPELRHEPRLALDGGPDGFSVIRRLIAALPGLLRPESSIALIEADPRSARRAAELAAAMLHARVGVLADLAGLDRCIEVHVGAV
jgi:release factor glutamine methyltransferase